MSPVTRHIAGFTLLEVMFAVVAFCTATFAILALVSQSLEIARRLQRPMVDAGLVASQLSLTNKLVEGMASGDLGELLGDNYKGYTWDYAVDEAQTNKLFQVVIAVQRNDGGRPVVSKMTVCFTARIRRRAASTGEISQMKLKLSSRESRVGESGRPVHGARSCHSSPVTRHLPAFTLIEVMIAMTIFSLVMAAIYSSWDLILRASRVSRRRRRRCSASASPSTPSRTR